MCDVHCTVTKTAQTQECEQGHLFMGYIIFMTNYKQSTGLVFFSKSWKTLCYTVIQVYKEILDTIIGAADGLLQIVNRILLDTFHETWNSEHIYI